MSLLEYAQNELKLAGLLEKDSDYAGMLGESVLELVKVFAAQGHSGYSAFVTLDVFNLVANFKPLTPITDDPAQWMLIDEDMAGQPSLFQCRRDPSLFSLDGGKTYYSVDDDERTFYESAKS